MSSHNQTTQLSIMLAGFLATVVGFAITAFSDQLFGSVLTLVGAVLLLAGGIMIAIASRHANGK